MEVCLGLRCVATNIQEICWCATTEFDDIHGGHCKASSIHHTSNFTIQSNVVQVYFCSCNLSQPNAWWFCFTWVYICLFEGQQTQQKRHGQNAGGQTFTLFLKSVMLQHGAKRRWYWCQPTEHSIVPSVVHLFLDSTLYADHITLCNLSCIPPEDLLELCHALQIFPFDEMQHCHQSWVLHLLQQCDHLMSLPED